jgi:uncharacterized protein with HEPN domain
VSSEDPTRRFRDIIANIARIRRYIDGMTAERFLRDHKTQDAVERCLQRITEAARKLGDALDKEYPEVEFDKLRRLGSVLRHDYDEIMPQLVWRSATTRLDALEDACRRELGRGKPKRPRR